MLAAVWKLPALPAQAALVAATPLLCLVSGLVPPHERFKPSLLHTEAVH